VLDLLKEVLDDLGTGDAPWQATVGIIFSRGNKRDPIKALQALLRMESLPGQRLVMVKYPSYLAHPPEAYQGEALVPPNILSKDGRHAVCSINTRRRETFIHHLTLYGVRSIHSGVTQRR
jgi:hypothetical protein